MKKIAMFVCIMVVMTAFVCEAKPKPKPEENRSWAKFQQLMPEVGFTKGIPLNGFQTYERGVNIISMLQRKGDCIEGFVILKAPVSKPLIREMLFYLYGPLQVTLRDGGRRYVDLSKLKDRSTELTETVLMNLSQQNEAEFLFDFLKVRAICKPVSQKEYDAGKRPPMYIKIWIP